MRISDGESLAFNLAYEVRQIDCARAGCAGCDFAHREQTGEATLTVAGPAALVQEAAALVFPDLAKVLNPPTAEPEGYVVEFCNWCPTPAAPSLKFHPDGKAEHREPVSAYLSAEQLDVMHVGATVTAFGPNDREQRAGHRCRWIKTDGRRWRPAGGNFSYTGKWLANHRQPMLDTSSDTP